MNERFKLGRAFYEGAVIVGSILLAFAIDAAWDAHRERAAELEAMSDEAVRTIRAEQIEAYERAMGQWMTFEPRGGVLSSLVGDGQLGLIRDDELRNALGEWLQRLDDSTEEAGMLVRTSERIALRWNHFADIRKPGSGELLATLRNDPEMTALVRSKLFFGQLYAGELRRLATHGEKVLVEIRAHRDRRTVAGVAGSSATGAVGR